MSRKKKADYAILDQPRVLAGIFHPRPENAHRDITQKDILIPVEADIQIGACFHMAGKKAPTILFFHGNGEIVSDYDDLGDIYNSMGINFMVVDYRGYGRSNGTPLVSAMMEDCHVVLEYTLNYLKERGCTGPLTVMGRSLGSASALALAAQGKPGFKNLIIESGFAYAGPLLKVLGINPASIGFHEEMGFENIEKIRQWRGPALVIHAEFDHIIPFTDGQALYDACGSENKELLKIPGANHNDIFFRGMNMYVDAVGTFLREGS